MKVLAGSFLGTLVFFGVIIFSNAFMGIQTDFVMTLFVAFISHCFISLISSLLIYAVEKRHKHVEDLAIEEEKKETKKEEQFNITIVDFDNCDIIGSFGGTNIYNKVNVTFDNGFKVAYDFADTIKYDSIVNVDTKSLIPGSLVLEPGIVYSPKVEK